ncbi:MAG: Asp-tRNA(Asn)/Glu-tRNA(Gln) amidotransferase subunit GatA [Spirochaetota bacterium]|nr:Asp-tRNA(Asn)/Glu-tRNA(Gln) amidotransferase subunit GatA [Spirochaetota bacterium]
MSLTDLSIQELREKLDKKEISSVELCKEYIKNIEKDSHHEKPLNALITLCNDMALSMAEKADERIAAGESAPLLGIPIIIKDNINVKGVSSSCASGILDGYLASFNATVSNRLQEAGAVFLGKANMDEFAMGSSSEHSVKGAVRNPVDRDRSPGGSSGGSAAVVKANWAPASLGSDTGGSIRQPAAFCGVYGMKPTYGRVSRYGLIAYSSSLDQIGPFANNIHDLALILETISGHDPLDSTSSSEPVPKYSASLDKDIKGLKVGIAKEYMSDSLDESVRKKVDETVDQLRDLGCEIKEISLPHSEYGIPCYYIIATAEASSNLSRFDGIRYGRRVESENLHDTFLNTRSAGFGDEVKRRIILGTYVLSSGYYDAYYLKAQKVRSLIKEDFVKAFSEVDLLITPTSPSTAFKIGEKLDDPLQMYLSDIYTVNLNLAGLPGISIPRGGDDSGLPVGVQLIGNYFKEELILNVASKLG